MPFSSEQIGFISIDHLAEAIRSEIDCQLPLASEAGDRGEDDVLPLCLCRAGS